VEGSIEEQKETLEKWTADADYGESGGTVGRNRLLSSQWEDYPEFFMGRGRNTIGTQQQGVV